MKRDPLVYGVIGFLIGAVIIWLLATYAVNNNMTGMMQMIGMRNRNQGTMSSDTIDAHFIEQMIPHHEDAIMMAKLAQTKGARQEVKTLSENIISSQGKEIDQMKIWYKNWFGRDLPTGDQVMSQHGMMGNNSGMHMGMMGTQDDLTRLENASDFDTAFVEHMILHHQMAVMMASMLKQGTQRTEMKQLADDIITAQTSEIDQMREWLGNWNKPITP